MYISKGVTACLYGGITDKITYVENQIKYYKLHNNDEFIKSIIKESYNDIKEAIEFYTEYCVLSAKFLQDEFEKLTAKYNEIMNFE